MSCVKILHDQLKKDQLPASSLLLALQQHALTDFRVK